MVSSSEADRLIEESERDERLASAFEARGYSGASRRLRSRAAVTRAPADARRKSLNVSPQIFGLGSLLIDDRELLAARLRAQAAAASELSSRSGEKIAAASAGLAFAIEGGSGALSRDERLAIGRARFPDAKYSKLKAIALARDDPQRARAEAGLREVAAVSAAREAAGFEGTLNEFVSEQRAFEARERKSYASEQRERFVASGASVKASASEVSAARDSQIRKGNIGLTDSVTGRPIKLVNGLAIAVREPRKEASRVPSRLEEGVGRSRSGRSVLVFEGAGPSSAAQAFSRLGYSVPELVGDVTFSRLPEQTVKERVAGVFGASDDRGYSEASRRSKIFRQVVTASNPSEARLAGLPGVGSFELLSEQREDFARKSFLEVNAPGVAASVAQAREYESKINIAGKRLAEQDFSVKPGGGVSNLLVPVGQVVKGVQSVGANVERGSVRVADYFVAKNKRLVEQGTPELSAPGLPVAAFASAEVGRSLKEKPVSAGVGEAVAVGAGFGLVSKGLKVARAAKVVKGSRLLSAGVVSAQTVETGAGVLLGGAFGVQTVREVSVAPDLESKGAVLGEAALDVAGFAAGAKIGGSLIKSEYKKKPNISNDERFFRFEKINESFASQRGKPFLSSITSERGGVTIRVPDIPKLPRIKFTDVSKPARDYSLRFTDVSKPARDYSLRFTDVSKPAKPIEFKIKLNEFKSINKKELLVNVGGDFFIGKKGGYRTSSTGGRKVSRTRGRKPVSKAEMRKRSFNQAYDPRVSFDKGDLVVRKRSKGLKSERFVKERVLRLRAGESQARVSDVPVRQDNPILKGRGTPSRKVRYRRSQSLAGIGRSVRLKGNEAIIISRGGRARKVSGTINKQLRASGSSVQVSSLLTKKERLSVSREGSRRLDVKRRPSRKSVKVERVSRKSSVGLLDRPASGRESLVVMESQPVAPKGFRKGTYSRVYDRLYAKKAAIDAARAPSIKKIVLNKVISEPVAPRASAIPVLNEIPKTDPFSVSRRSEGIKIEPSRRVANSLSYDSSSDVSSRRDVLSISDVGLVQGLASRSSQDIFSVQASAMDNLLRLSPKNKFVQDNDFVPEGPFSSLGDEIIKDPVKRPRLDPVAPPIDVPRRISRGRGFGFDLPVPEFPKLSPSLPLYGKGEGVAGFQVLVRRKGEFVKASNSLLSEAQALELGSLIAEGGAAQTFKIVDAGETIVPEGDDPSRGRLSSLLKRFTKKDGVYREKKEFLINSPGELQQITLKGVQASSRARSQLRRLGL